MAEPGNGGDKVKAGGVAKDDPAAKPANGLYEDRKPMPEPKGGEKKVDGATEWAAPTETEDERRAKLVGEFIETGKTTAGSQDKAEATSAANADKPSARPGNIPDVRIGGTEKDVSDKPTEVVNPKEMAERLGKGLQKLEDNMRHAGYPTDLVAKVRRDLASTDTSKIDLSGSTQIVERLNMNASQGQLKSQSAEVLMKMVEANLADKVAFVTPQNVEAATSNKVFNRENPSYREGNTNCRACSASFVINEVLPEKALMLQFENLIDGMNNGDLKFDRVQIPVENGEPKMSALVYQRLYGSTHNGVAGEKSTTREVEEFRRLNESVPKYIQRGLETAGFSNVQLTRSSWPTPTPGYYVLEHPTAGGGPVDGHVTIGYVDAAGKAYLIDRQNPEVDTNKMQVFAAHRITFDGAAIEQQVTVPIPGDVRSEPRTRVINPDGTVRDLRIRQGELTAFTDVDGSEYSKDASGRWKVRTGTTWGDAPFEKAEYLGPKEGMKFAYGSHVVTEKPSGEATVQIPNRSIVDHGKPLSVSGTEVKLNELVSKVTRTKEGKWQATFRDGTQTEISSDNSRPEDRRSVKQIGEALSGSTEGGTKRSGVLSSGADGAALLDRAVTKRLAHETESGIALDKAIVKVGHENIDNTGVERLSHLEDALKQSGVSADARTLARFDRVMAHMNMTEADLPKVAEIVKRAETHLSNGTTIKKDGALLSESQALDLAMIEATTDPARGKPYTSSSALARLRSIEDMRAETAGGTVKEITVPQGLEMMRIKDHSLKDSTMPSETGKMTERGRLNQLHRLVTQPEVLSAAEKLMAQDPKLSLTDAANIASVNGLRNSPELASELMTSVRMLRQGITLEGGTKSNLSVKTSELLEIAKYMKEHDIPATSKNIPRVRTALAAGTTGDGIHVDTVRDVKAAATAADGKISATTGDGTKSTDTAAGKIGVPGDRPITARVQPIVDALSRPEGPVLTIERLEAARETLGREKVNRGDAGQSNVFNLLNDANPKAGILAKLKAEGRISADWEVYPTEMGSPADKVGADFLLVNKKTGAFHMLDATQRGEKPNIYSLRAGGVITFDRELFDIGGKLKLPTDHGAPADIEIAAIDFKADLEAQIEGLTKTESHFKLGETPVGDVRKTTPDATKEQVDNLSRWAKQKAFEAGETEQKPGQFLEMSRIVEKANRFQEITETQQVSPTFDNRVKKAFEREIARYTYSQLMREPYAELPRGGATNVYYHNKSDSINLETTEKENFVTKDVKGVLGQAYSAALDGPTLLANLSNAQLQKLGIDAKAFKTSGGDLTGALRDAYKNDHHPQHEKVKFQADRLAAKLITLRSEIEAGGKLGEGSRRPIIENTVRTLSNKTEDSLTGRETTIKMPPRVEARPIRGGGELFTDVPNAAEKLEWLLGEKVQGSKPVKGVLDAMYVLLEEEREKPTWSADEREKFEKLRQTYESGDARVVEKVHDWLNNSQEIKDQIGQQAADEAAKRSAASSKRTGVQQSGEPAPKSEPSRPARQMVADRNLSRSQVDTKPDGTRAIFDPQSPIGKLAWNERLTNEEVKGLLDAKKTLEDRERKGEVLKAEETARLESLRYFEANMDRPDVHRAIIEQVGPKRPAGGFKASQVGSGLMAMSFLVVAILQTQAAEAAPSGSFRRAKFQ